MEITRQASYRGFWRK